MNTRIYIPTHTHTKKNVPARNTTLSAILKKQQLLSHICWNFWHSSPIWQPAVTNQIAAAVFWDRQLDYIVRGHPITMDWLYFFQTVLKTKKKIKGVGDFSCVHLVFLFSEKDYLSGDCSPHWNSSLKTKGNVNILLYLKFSHLKMTEGNL